MFDKYIASAKKWIKDPTTIGGLALAMFTLVLELLGGTNWKIAAASFTASFVLLVLPGNTSASGDARQAFLDGVTLVATKGQAGSAAAFAHDAIKLAGDLHPNTQVVPVEPLPIQFETVS